MQVLVLVVVDSHNTHAHTHTATMQLLVLQVVSGERCPCTYSDAVWCSERTRD